MPIGLQLFCTDELNKAGERESFCQQTRLSSMISKIVENRNQKMIDQSFRSNLHKIWYIDDKSFFGGRMDENTQKYEIKKRS